jgi:glycine/D-amino acid oxidase-like deaminating enzyme
VYAQRTADDRLAFGGRGAPYRFGSRIPVAFDPHPGMAEALRRALVELFPDAGGAAVTHRWSGALAAPRDFWCSVRFDRRSGMGAAGGYVGDGVATSNLAGRILADLVTGADTPITRLPIVGHRSPRWEPEPLRWVGVNLVRHVAASADRSEARTGRVPRRRVAVLHRLLGG